MFLIRDAFTCKPGQSSAVAEKFKRAHVAMGITSRVMVDVVATYWTVVLEMEVETLGAYEGAMQTYRDNADVKEAMAGYLDLVVSGRREIFRLV